MKEELAKLLGIEEKKNRFFVKEEIVFKGEPQRYTVCSELACGTVVEHLTTTDRETAYAKCTEWNN